MARRIEPIGLWLAVGIVGIIALAVLPYRALEAEVESVVWVEHTHRVIEGIGDVEKHLSETQAARRGFALTGDAAELTRFATSASRLDEAAASVRALTADNPRQQDRLARLAPLLASCRAIQESANAKRRADGFVLVEEAAAERRAETVVRQLVPLLGELVAEEQRLLVERDRRASEGVSYARWINIPGTGAAVIVVLLAIAMLRRENSRRRRSEVLARQSEARFARLAESGIVGITSSDMNGTFTEANDAFLEMVGYSREELFAGKVTAKTITPTDLWEPDQNAVRTLLATGIISLREKEYVRRDGARVPVLVAGAMVNAEECIGFILDITDRHRIELALRVSEVRFRRLMETGIMGIVVSDTAGKVTEANDAFLSMVGYSRADLDAGELSGARLNTPDRERTDANARALLASQGFAPPWEKELVRKDGRRVPVLIGVAMLEAPGNIALVVDLTEQRKAQELVRHLREERTANALFRELLEAAPDAMVIADGQGLIALVNAQALKLFGYAREEMLGKPAAMLVPLRALPEHRDGWQGYGEARLRQMGDVMELVGLRKDGTELAIEVRHSPLQTDGGVLVSSAIRDITERRKSEDKLRASEEALLQVNRELESFSYSVAHDLRAPLRGMNGFAQVLLDTYQDKLDAEGKEWLGLILSSAQRMGALIDALLSLARVTRGNLSRDRVDLSAIVRAAVAELATAEPGRSVEIVVPEHAWVDADPSLVRALVQNLVGNAWKFTLHADAARIELGVAESGGADAFFVRDNGAGFDMAYASKLFGAFQRLHTESEFRGTGIGLATVQRIVHRHGGRVWAEGVVDHGATFFFTLPSAG